jgi:hypothetical protein
MFMCKAFYQQTSWATMAEAQGVTPKTLVVHGAGDQILPVERGRALAGALPNANFVQVRSARIAARECPPRCAPRRRAKPSASAAEWHSSVAPSSFALLPPPPLAPPTCP